MRASTSLRLLAAGTMLVIGSVPLAAQQPEKPPAAKSKPTPAPKPLPELPPLPEGVSELKFDEIFAPFGPRGLEYTAKAKALDGKRVRLLGYMVRTCRHDHGRFLLTPMPMTLHDHENGPADDLPPCTLFVDVPPLRRALKFIPHQPGLFLLTGKLSLGGRDEMHGRRSWVRLELERPDPAAAATDRKADGNPVAEAVATPAVREQVEAVDTLPVPTKPASDEKPTTERPAGERPAGERPATTETPAGPPTA